MPEKLFCVKLHMIIIKLPHEVRVDQDHEAMLHDIMLYYKIPMDKTR